MNVYLSGSTVNLALPLTDEFGNELLVVDAAYRVLSQANEVMIDTTAINLVGDQSEVIVNIPAEFNTLADELKALRTVELTMQTASGGITVLHRYVIESPNLIQVGVSSFQTFSEALLEANYMVGVETFMRASDSDKRAALIQAHTNLLKLKYTVSDADRDEQIYINWHLSPSGFQRDRIDLSLLTIEEIGNLNNRLLNGLRKAQIAEADHLLGGETVADKRRIGLMSETVGESSNMFRTGKPVKMAICERAIEHLAGMINWSVIARR